MKHVLQSIVLFGGLVLASPLAHAEACFYSGKNFTGDSFCLLGSEFIPDMHESGYNSHISSVRITDGETVDISDYSAQERVFHTSVRDLSSLGLTNDIASILVR